MLELWRIEQLRQIGQDDYLYSAIKACIFCIHA
jgi:hypothetical protein